jgi:hypothetical protein
VASVLTEGCGVEGGGGGVKFEIGVEGIGEKCG